MARTTTAGTTTVGTSGRDRDERRRKVVLTALVAAAVTAVATQGSEATFTATASRGHSITTGNPMLVLGLTGTPANRLGVDVTGLIPGGTAQRSFDLQNTGSYTLTSYTLSTTVTTSSLLDTDTTNGLQVKLERCSVPWVESGTLPNFSYTCGPASSPGTTTTVVPLRPISFTNVPVTGMVSAAPTGTDHLLLTEQLPATAGNSFQNLTSAVTFTFNAS
ncbi:TasA family protein [Kineococcus gypseus]|uniref:TasA family protein n=1 Tax=Kineococcus gypseus TaxID=1637102 RepID=UPI003D7CD523